MLLLLSPQLFAQTLDRDAVLDKLVEAYGGEQNLRRLENVVQEWDMVALMSKRHGTDVRHIGIPGQLQVVLTYPQKVERRMLSGDQGRVSFNGGQPYPATEPQRDAMRLQLMRLYSPLVLRDKADNVTLTVDGDYHALSLVEHGVRADYLVNTRDWRIEKVAGTLNMGGRAMRFLTEYSDFEFIDGVLVHRKENKFAGSVNTAMLSLKDIRFNAEPLESGPSY
jgi:hypothetical protein